MYMKDAQYNNPIDSTCVTQLLLEDPNTTNYMWYEK